MHQPHLNHFYYLREKKSKPIEIENFIGSIIFQTHLIKKSYFSRITIEKDTKVQNAVVFTVNKEDHTIGNMLRA
jgi:hypothetical protein